MPINLQINECRVRDSIKNFQFLKTEICFSHFSLVMALAARETCYILILFRGCILGTTSVGSLRHMQGDQKVSVHLIITVQKHAIIF
jgi:hypothetical protein